MTLRAYKFNFKAYIGKLTINTSVQCNILVTWKRSSESHKTQLVPFANGSATFD